MTLKELLIKTAEKHTEFDQMMNANLDEQLQKYSLTSDSINEYSAATDLLRMILTDSLGSLVETWINPDN